MADDFEKAVFYAFAQPGTAPADVSARAGAALEAARAGPQAWALCLAHLRSSAHAEVKFWCLQTLHGLVGERYGELAPDQRDALKSALVGTALGDPGLAPFLRAKLAQVLVGVACREFPSAWPAFFQDLIATLPAGPPAADLFCRVLVAVDEDVVSLEVPRSAAEARASMAFKDAMRDLALPDVAAAATQLLAASHAADPPAAAALLRALARYVHWVDIGLVANDRFVPLLFGVLGSRDEGLRAAAAGVLIEIVGKRMEAEPKLALIQQLGVVPEAAKWAEGLPGAEDGDAGSELAAKYARLLACLATEILEAVKKIENAVLSMAAVGLAVDDEAGREAEASARGACALLDALFPALLRALGGGGEEVVAAVLPFLLSYVGWVRAAARRKGNAGGGEAGAGADGATTPARGAAHLPAILEAAAAAARYPADSAVPMGAPAGPAARAAAEEEEAAMAERRQDLFTLFRNAARLDPAAALAFVRSALSAVLFAPDAPWQGVELAVALLYQLGEAPSDADLRPGTGALAELALGVMRSDHPAAAHRLVALGVLEACVRYARVLAAPGVAAGTLPHVVAGFLGARGLGHADPGVQRRAAYLLCRLTKALRAPLRGAAQGVLAALAPHLAAIAATPAAEPPGPKAAPGRGPGGAALTAVDDRLYAFEAAGLLLGQEEMEAGEQAAWLAAVLQPLTRQIEEALGEGQGPSNGSAALVPPALMVQQALEGITRVAKGFSLRLCTELRPALGAEFTRALRCAIQVPRRLPGHRALRARLLSFLHRMVETLGPASLPFMPEVLQALVREGADACELADALILLNQLMSRFRDGMAPLIRDILPVLLSCVHAVLGPDWDWSGAAVPGSPPAASAETAREKEELQRAFFACLLCVATMGLADQLLAAGSATLDGALGPLLQAGGGHTDVTVRKTCIQTLHRLLSVWMEPSKEAGAAITTFAVEKFAGEVCLRCMLGGQSRLDPGDASSIGLLAEAAAGLRLVDEHAREELARHLLRHGLDSGSVFLGWTVLGWPAAASTQLLQLIADGDHKVLRDFLRQALQQQPRPAAAKLD
ncbi:XPO2 [Auxenochlorella protothecoides x Auxenochlorella symbiontica]